MRKTFALHLCWLAMTAACNDDDPSRGMGTDAAMPAAPDAAPPGPDAGAGEPPDAAPPDAAPPEPDGGPTGPTIESVETSDGYTQVRQGGGTVELVIMGRNLGAVTDVVVGELRIVDAVATPGEIRASVVVPHGATPGSRDVTVSGLDGPDTERDAIEVTPYVVTPVLVPPGGHGTFQSPLRLCDEVVETSRSGDTILLLAGEHICQERVDLREGGQIVQGQGTATTIIGQPGRGFPGFEIRPLPFSPTTTTFRDFRMQAAPPTNRAAMDMTGGGALLVERIDTTGPAVKIGGGCLLCEKSVTVRESSFFGTGIFADGLSRVEVSDSTFTEATQSVGVRASGGRVSITRSTFDRCLIGVHLRKGDTEPAQVEIGNSIFTDTRISMNAGRVAIMDSSIIDSRRSDQLGRSVSIDGGGELEATRVTIARTGGTGIDAFVGPVEVGSARVSLTEVLIEGGHYGVRLHGSSKGGGLFMTSSIVRNQTVAAVSYGFANAAYDFGGGNQLSVESGFALEDARVSPLFTEPIPAAGILLNGRPQSGLVRGPLEQPPDLRIDDPRSAIQF